MSAKHNSLVYLKNVFGTFFAIENNKELMNTSFYEHNESENQFELPGTSKYPRSNYRGLLYFMK